MDRDAFEVVRRRQTRLTRAIESGSRLVPGFGELAQDLFAVFYKHNVVRRFQRGKTPAPALLAERVLNWVLDTPGLAATKQLTQLAPEASGLAVARALERVVEILKRPVWFDQNDLLAQFELQRLQTDLDQLQARLDAADELLAQLPEEARDDSPLSDIAEDLGQERRAVQSEMRRLSQQQNRELDQLPVEAENRVKNSINEFPSQMEAAQEAADSVGHSLGVDGRGLSAAEKMSLGEKLLSSEKLQKLARLVGLFKQVARGARKRQLERSASTIHSIDRGHDLARVLSSESVLLTHPALRKEFMRRMTDDLLTQYQLMSDEPSGRGPLIVCIDASGSMQGERELWSKAIALTFLEIAQRERRAFRGIVFSGSQRDARSFALLESGRERRRVRKPKVDPTELVRFAEYFPGGGTDFETPLSLALASLEESRFRRGDVVFITDGMATINPEFLANFNQKKAELGFKVFAVHVDLRGESDTRLRQFADEVLGVSQLRAEELSRVFQKV